MALKASPATTKAKFVLATDGEWFEAEDLGGRGTVACRYADFPDHFGFFLPLAGITTVIFERESPTFPLPWLNRVTMPAHHDQLAENHRQLVNVAVPVNAPRG